MLRSLSANVLRIGKRTAARQPKKQKKPSKPTMLYGLMAVSCIKQNGLPFGKPVVVFALFVRVVSGAQPLYGQGVDLS